MGIRDLFSKIRDLFSKIRDLFSTTRLRDQKKTTGTPAPAAPASLAPMLFRIVSIIINYLEVVRCINVIIITVIQRFLSHHDGIYSLKVKLVYNT